MTDDIHSCSYYCDRPACIKAQRDELVRKYVEAQEKACPMTDLEPVREAIVYAATNGDMDKWRRVLALFDSFAYRYKNIAPPAERVRVPE